jgi:hypothetical protein
VPCRPGAPPAPSYARHRAGCSPQHPRPRPQFLRSSHPRKGLLRPSGARPAHGAGQLQ